MDERALAVKRCVSDIEVADFVALDLEFSGLFLDAAKSGKVLSYEDYFAKCAESVPKFLALQLGICCAQQRKENNGGETDRSGWDLRTHQLDLWPSEHRVFSVDLQSLRFLRSHGFDFNAFLEKAHPYQRLQKSATSATPKPLGAAQVMAALRTAQVPLVVHNGLLDLLHLYDKFLGDLPEDFEDFGKAWLEHFPLTFDTRFVAQEGRLQVFKHPGGLSLQTLFTHLRASSSLQLQRSPEPQTSQGQASHSAGYDAYVTAAVFLMEMDAWLRFDRKKSEAPAEAPAEAPSQATTLETETVEMAVQPTPAEEDEGWQPARKRARKARAPALSDPSLLENHKICRRFHNKIALVNTSPGFFVMGPPKG